MNLLGLFQFDAFLNPWFLMLLALVPLLFSLEVSARAPGAIDISTGEVLHRIQRRPGLFWRLPALLRALALALLIVGLARPVQGLQPRRDNADVIDIMLCLDVSGSMRAMDFVAQGEPQERVAVVREAVRHFIDNRKVRAGARYGLDRIGLVLYAGYAWTQCPLTLDYGVLDREVANADVDDQDQSKQGTAIGSAMGLAVSKLRKSEAKSKVIILLTDGRNNAGELDPITSAQIAKEYGIKVYTIGAGTGGTVLVPERTPFGVIMQQYNLPIDEETLKKIAEIAGGRYFRAADTASLEGAYAEINKLEATEIEVNDYYDYEDGFVPWVVLGSALMLASILSRRRWFEAIP